MPRPLSVIALLVAAAGAAAACGSSSTSVASTATTLPPATAAPATAPVATTAPGPSGGIPAVRGATDLTAEPVVAAGGDHPPTRLEVRDLVVGTGAAAVASDTVKVQYVGVLYASGKVFDASWTDSGPTSFPLGEVVPGFRDAIVGMHVGGRREVVIPPALGYGAAGDAPAIPGNATLVFVIDLLAVP